MMPVTPRGMAIRAGFCALLAACVASVALSATARPSPGKEFYRYKNCAACTAEGYGWCPIRRKCGGFANRVCSGTETDSEVPLVQPLEGRAAFEATAWQPGVTSFVLFHDPADEAHAAVAAAFEEASGRLHRAPSTVKTVVAFGSLDCAEHAAACVGHYPGHGEAKGLPGLTSFRRVPYAASSLASPHRDGAGEEGLEGYASNEAGTGSHDKAVQAYGEADAEGDMADADALHGWMQQELAASRANVEELDRLADRFMEAFAAGGMAECEESRTVLEEARKHVEADAAARARARAAIGMESMALDVDAVGNAISAGVGGESVEGGGARMREVPAHMRADDVGNIYLWAMQQVHAHGTPFLSNEVNRARSSALKPRGVAKLEVLERFVKALFG